MSVGEVLESEGRSAGAWTPESEVEVGFEECVRIFKSHEYLRGISAVSARAQRRTSRVHSSPSGTKQLAQDLSL